MGKPHFSTRGLLAGTALVAVSCGALVSANEWIASLMFTLTLATMLVATLGAVLRRGRARPYWTGFALVGWGYLVLVHTPFHDAYFPVAVDKAWRLHEDGPILTTKVLGWVYHRFLRVEDDPFAPSVGGTSGGLGGGSAGGGSRGRGTGGGMFGKTESVITRVQMGGGLRPNRTAVAVVRPGPELKDFLRVGQSLFALLFAYCGGLAGRWFYDRNVHT